MKEAVSLTVRVRQKRGKGVKHLRQEKRIPGVLYGHAIENQPVECAEQEFHKVFVKAGESTVVDLTLEGKTVPVLIHEIAFDPVTNRYAHIDFLALDMRKEVTTHVPVRTIGEAPGVKAVGGVLMHNRDTLTVKCLPKDLPHAIEVDLSPLQNFHDTITVAALTIPPRVTVLEKPEEIVVSLQPPRKEEEVAPAATAGVEGATAEGAVAAEGGTPAAAAQNPEATGEKKGKEEKKGK